MFLFLTGLRKTVYRQRGGWLGKTSEMWRYERQREGGSRSHREWELGDRVRDKRKLGVQCVVRNRWECMQAEKRELSPQISSPKQP